MKQSVVLIIYTIYIYTIRSFKQARKKNNINAISKINDPYIDQFEISISNMQANLVQTTWSHLIIIKRV